MFRTNASNATIKRTMKVLHERHQATAVAVDLDSDPGTQGINDSIYSGMVAVWSDGTAGTVKRLENAGTETPIGLFGLDKNADIDDLNGQPSDLTPFVIYQGGPDFYVELDAAVVEDSVFSASVGDPLYPVDEGILSDDDRDCTTGDEPVGEIVEVDTAGNKVVARILLPSQRAAGLSA